MTVANPPTFLCRFVRVTRALRILTMHPDGLPLRQLAAQLEVDEETLREEIIAFYRADVDPAADPNLFREVRIQFVGPDGEPDSVDPAEAEIVRASNTEPTTEVGVVHSSPGELANVYRAGYALLSVEPENSVLDGALHVLGETMLRGIRPVDDYWKAELASTLLDAIRRRRRVRMTHVPSWGQKSREVVIAPYRLLRTRRGWELDAAESVGDDSVGDDSVGDDDAVSTFLLTSIREAVVLDESFERPVDVDRQIDDNRHEQEVDVVVSQDARWVVDRFAESSVVVDEDEDCVKLRARLLPPVDQRLGMLLLVAGPDAFVTAPECLIDAGRLLARDLLAHHTTAASQLRHTGTG